MAPTAEYVTECDDRSRLYSWPEKETSGDNPRKTSGSDTSSSHGERSGELSLVKLELLLGLKTCSLSGNSRRPLRPTKMRGHQYVPELTGPTSNVETYPETSRLVPISHRPLDHREGSRCDSD